MHSCSGCRPTVALRPLALTSLSNSMPVVYANKRSYCSLLGLSGTNHSDFTLSTRPPRGTVDLYKNVSAVSMWSLTPTCSGGEGRSGQGVYAQTELAINATKVALHQT